MRKGDYNYFIHPITDGVPEVKPELLHEVISEIRSLLMKEYDKKRNSLFIIGEFPEELGSYRQMVARVLNNMNTIYSHRDRTKYPSYRVRCLTGDIGLHVGLGIKENMPLSIRCYRCNQNNELVNDREHYHPVENIQETVMKRLHCAMIYQCISRRHAILPIYAPEHFINFPMPDIRYVVL